ncbi:hypothetical protein SAMN04488109_3688 [Chryseolinea serpens]|uniref:Outer membrane protein beta-barrel domain-containing protein n=1 Tax=Chryseolinea serpens TaxID=947013 RepID=A0A1M5S0S3_9BACT|nr:hypothetical protein [Chryseolinea serpens]SHH32076.1 hypothetical protein SAMN04488109_3688 [Chryseolinea serpens]
MKLKSILVSALCVAALSGYGQTEKGTVLLGGSLTFSHSDNTTTFANGGTTFPTDSKQVNIRLSPSISYFVIKRLAVGVITPYTYTRITANDQHATGHTYAVGPIARYYFLLGNHWAIFPEASYTYGWMKNPLLLTDSNNQTFKSNGNTHEFQGGIGGVYFLNKSIGLEGKFYYDASHSDYSARQVSFLENGSTDITSLNFSAGVQIYLGRSAQ